MSAKHDPRINPRRGDWIARLIKNRLGFAGIHKRMVLRSDGHTVVWYRKRPTRPCRCTLKEWREWARHASIGAPPSTRIITRKLPDAQVGFCHPNGQIDLDPRQLSKDYLDSLVHEVLHRELPELSEQQVIEIAAAMTAAIWRRNYRRIQA